MKVNIFKILSTISQIYTDKYKNTALNQELDKRYIVVYNKSGSYLTSAVIDRKDLEGHFFVDGVFYFFFTNNELEAFYLSAILNSYCVNNAIKPFQSKGALGPRDIHKIPLQTKIPKYCETEILHTDLAEFGKDSTNKSKDSINQIEENIDIGRKRSLMREFLSNELNSIDELVKKLLDF